MASDTRFPSLDGFRALAILLVLGEHASMSIGFPPAAQPIRTLFSGYLGVRAFFVLSGFLITALLLGEYETTGRISLGRFYARRALRIVPAYAAYVTLLVILQATTALHFGACNWITTATFTKDLGCGHWLDGHFWSLAVEEQFYLVWPLVLVAAPRRWRMRVVWLSVAGATAARGIFFLLGWYEWEIFSPFVNVDALMLGSALALWRSANVEGFTRFFETDPAIGRTVATILVLINIFRDRLAPGGPLGVSLIDTLAAGAVAYLVASFVVVRRGPGYSLLNARPVVWLGVLSYSIYIWQVPFFDAYNDFHVAAVPVVMTFPVNLVAAIGVGMVSYYLLERPLLGLRHRLRDAGTGRAEVRRGARRAPVTDGYRIVAEPE